MSALRRAVDYLFVDHWRAIDADVDRERTEYDWRPLVVMVVVAVSLTLQYYFGERSKFSEYFPPGEADWTGDHYQLWQFVWWSGWRFLGYVVIPVAVLLVMPGMRVRDCGLSFDGFFRHLWIYLVLFLAITPAVIIASQTAGFYKIYPFYKLANRSAFDLWAWEGLYVLQFLSLEFFFRGFMLQTLRRSLGSYAIFAMIVPYCMIHFDKHLAEVLGAIGAGVILGTLAMRTRSIWGGVLIHVGVAITMDLLALGHCPDYQSTGDYCPRR